MKQMISLLLLSCLFLSGCGVGGERIKEPVTFYYVSEDYQKDMQQVIASEVREASGHRRDLSYLLALYSMGPTTEELKSLLPRNTSIRLETHTAEGLALRLSEGALTMSEADFTLASACIFLTCMELTDVPEMTIACGERSITIQEDSLMMYNNTTPTPQEETE